jgi:hypothetical protein
MIPLLDRKSRISTDLVITTPLLNDRARMGKLMLFFHYTMSLQRSLGVSRKENARSLQMRILSILLKIWTFANMPFSGTLPI